MTRTGASILETRLLLLYTSRQDGHQLHAGFSTCMPAGQGEMLIAPRTSLLQQASLVHKHAMGLTPDESTKEAMSKAAVRQDCTSRSHTQHWACSAAGGTISVTCYRAD